jgi:ABC-type spermidine/putrescine transport system permease subunit II
MGFRRNKDTPRKGRRLISGVLLFNIAIFSVLLFMVLPAFIVIPMSFDSSEYLRFPPENFSLKWYAEFFQSGPWLDSLWLSFKVALLTTLVSTLIGMLGSLALTRGLFPGKTFINAVVLSPMIIPVIILAVAVYGLYAKLGLIGTTIGLVFAHSVLAVPYVVIIMSSNLYRFDLSLELASMNLGANRIETFFLVTLPLILPGLVTSGIFSFITSFDELVVANFISGIRGTTLPKRMFDGIRMDVSPVVAAVSSVLIIVAIITIFMLQSFQNEENQKT